MSTMGDRWAPSEVPTSAARSPDHGAAPTAEVRNKQRYESNVSERDYILPQPGAYYEHDDREAQRSGYQPSGRRSSDSRARPHERHGRDTASFDRGSDRDRSGSYRSRPSQDTGRWDHADLRRPGDSRRTSFSRRERSPLDRHPRDRYIPETYSMDAQRAPNHRQQDRIQKHEGMLHTTTGGPSVKDTLTANRDECSEKHYRDLSSGDNRLPQQAPQWKGNGRPASEHVPQHSTSQGASDASRKWGHDKFQELSEDQSGAHTGQYKSILGLF